jgi:hypothetical protein
MDPLLTELAKLQRDGNLRQSIDDVDKIIEQLEKARETIVAGKDRSGPFEPEVAGSEARPCLEQLLICTRSKLCLYYSGETAESSEAWL